MCINVYPTLTWNSLYSLDWPQIKILMLIPPECWDCTISYVVLTFVDRLNILNFLDLVLHPLTWNAVSMSDLNI